MVPAEKRGLNLSEAEPAKIGLLGTVAGPSAS